MSSFPGTLLLLYHIKELETGKRYSPIDCSQKLSVPMWWGICTWGSFGGQKPVSSRRLSSVSPPPCQRRATVVVAFRNLEISHLNGRPFPVPIHQALPEPYKWPQVNMLRCFQQVCLLGKIQVLPEIAWELLVAAWTRHWIHGHNVGVKP